MINKDCIIRWSLTPLLLTRRRSRSDLTLFVDGGWGRVVSLTKSWSKVVCLVKEKRVRGMGNGIRALEIQDHYHKQRRGNSKSRSSLTLLTNMQEQEWINYYAGFSLPFFSQALQVKISPLYHYSKNRTQPKSLTLMTSKPQLFSTSKPLWEWSKSTSHQNLRLLNTSLLEISLTLPRKTAKFPLAIIPAASLVLETIGYISEPSAPILEYVYIYIYMVLWWGMLRGRSRLTSFWGGWVREGEEERRGEGEKDRREEGQKERMTEG